MNINPWFVTGFIEGEGAFTFSRNGQTIAPYFSLRQRTDYNDLVSAIHGFFGVGNIYFCSRRGTTKSTHYYRVTRREDLPVIIRHFEQYPIQSSHKRKAFELWKRLVKSKVWRRGYDPELFKLAQELSWANMKTRAKDLT